MKRFLLGLSLVFGSFAYSQCAATLTATNASDSSTCDGSITVAPIGGTGPYTYTWSCGGSASNSNTISNLCPGTCTVTIVDQNGCTASVTGIVGVASNPCASLYANITTSSSTGPNVCDGYISLSGNGGTAPYTYSISGNGITLSGGPMFSNLCAGNYSCQVTDANGCLFNSTVSVVANNFPCASLTMGITNVTNTSSPAMCDGSATAVASGGTAPYTYLWNNGVTTPTYNNFCLGNYSVCITDANGCQQCDSVYIADTTSNVNCNGFMANVSINNVTLAGACDGSIIPTVTGGTMPYMYLWSNGSTTASQYNLCEALYSLTVMDANGCSATVNAYVGSSTGNNGDTIILNGSISIDSTVIGTISGPWLDNCNFDFNTVSNAYISSYVDLVDSIIVTWTIEFNDGSTTTVYATYSFSPGNTGTYNVILQLYCGLRSTPQWLIAYGQMYYEYVGLNTIEENTIHVYPNPASTSISISGLQDSDVYEIQDGLGRIVLRASNQDTFDVSQLSNGIYSLVIRNENRMKTVRFIKQ
jgi:hypothetical protein